MLPMAAFFPNAQLCGIPANGQVVMKTYAYLPTFENKK